MKKQTPPKITENKAAMLNFSNFKTQLCNAVNEAIQNPHATKDEVLAVKKRLKQGGLSTGQYAIVIRTYNATKKRIDFYNK